MTGNKRFELWKTLDFDGHTDDWDIIDNTRLNIDEGHISEEEVCDLLNEKEKEIQRLKLIINGLNYALKNIRQIDVEIDLNECGDVE